MKLIKLTLLFLLTAGCAGHRNAGAAAETSTDVADEAATERSWPQFSADSAYGFVAEQVAFGPRVPGTAAHTACRDYLVEKFKEFGADSVWLQQGSVTAFNGTRLPLSNIQARFNGSAPKRILIAAHYDTRPWADEDDDEANHTRAIDGANDGASGVGVALELARNIGSSHPEIGVDFLLTDVEDYGSSGEDLPDGESSWALGSLYWAQSQPYAPRERPVYGILLDMVGGRDARFYREYFSEQSASWLNSKVWKAAEAEGITRFVNEQNGGVNDDHINIYRAGIPCIDIIECGNSETGSFPPHWHTMNDNLSAIDRATLGDVGATLMRVIYTEPRE
ncbi:MAG: M28 family peptidase [Bacteroides sp.]|nr:M28 family peptidase [Bacteroides sp.]